MREEEKIFAGKLFCPGDPELKELKRKAHRLSQDYNRLYDDETAAREEILKELLGEIGEGSFLQGPITFHYGCHTKIGNHVFINFNFTVQDDDFTLPPSVEDYFISNPDVEHHNAYATFTIDGEKKDCYTALVTTKHFEKEGESFFDYMTTALVPVDGSDVYYTPEEVPDFYDVFGKNTGYVIDPEECMADNFSYALIYGLEGPEGEEYPTPEIIQGILDYLSR